MVFCYISDKNNEFNILYHNVAMVTKYIYFSLKIKYSENFLSGNI